MPCGAVSLTPSLHPSIPPSPHASPPIPSSLYPCRSPRLSTTSTVPPTPNPNPNPNASPTPIVPTPIPDPSRAAPAQTPWGIALAGLPESQLTDPGAQVDGRFVTGWARVHGSRYRQACGCRMRPVTGRGGVGGAGGNAVASVAEGRAEDAPGQKQATPAMVALLASCWAWRPVLCRLNRSSFFFFFFVLSRVFSCCRGCRFAVDGAP